MNRCYLVCVVAALLALTNGGCSSPSATQSGRPGDRSASATTALGDTLTFTVVPYEAADKLNDEYSPMAKYLAKKAGCREGRFMPVVDYAGVLAALQSGQLDVAYLSPFPYALATSRMKLQPLAMPWVTGDLMYHGIIFVRSDSPIRALKDLAGHTMAFGDPSSTSGYLLPRALLEREGVFQKLKGWRNAGNATVVAKAVEFGTEDAGAAYSNLFMVVYKNEPEKAKKMRVIATTEDIPNGIYVARGDMPATDVEKLKKAFLDMNTDPEGRAAMLKAPNDRVVPADDRLFDHVRDAARAQKIDITIFDRKK